MRLIQLTDLHCRPAGELAIGRCDTNALAERALLAIRAFSPRPDALLLTGDLADDGTPGSYRLLAELLQRLIEIPVYAIPGNHDDRAAMRAELPWPPGIVLPAPFVQYTVEHLPVRLVMLDTLVPGSPHGALCAARLDWLEATLAAQPERPALIAMHHPPFACGHRLMDSIMLRQPEAFVALVARHRQVCRIVCGHAHRPITASVAHVVASIAPAATHQLVLDLDRDGARWCLEPPAFQLHQWIPGTGIVSHTCYVDAFPGPFAFPGPLPKLPR